MLNMIEFGNKYIRGTVRRENIGIYLPTTVDT